MEKKLYIVRITRLVMAASEPAARKLAASATNSDDVDTVRAVETLYDLPLGWEDAVPYGSAALSATSILAARIAADPRFHGFEVHACMKAGEDEHGVTFLEQCPDSEASLWSVYGQQASGPLECLGDFESRAKANAFLAVIEKAVMAQSLQQPERSEDGHLESLYEDRISAGNYEDF